MTDRVRPTEEEIVQWILHTSAHSFHVGYYLERLLINSGDPDLPHDVVNKGNKFEWLAVKGLALQFRPNGMTDFHNEIMTSRDYHRQQHHHQIWGQYYPNATEGEMMLGAIDAVCSQLEPRHYQGGCHTLDEIKRIASDNPIHKVPWMKLAVAEIRTVERLNIAEITAFSKIPKDRISPETYDAIMGRAEEAFKCLSQDHGYNFSKSLKKFDFRP